MRWRRGRGWRAVAASVGLVAVVTVALLGPTPAAATDSDLKYAYAFKVEASNGYSILGFAVNERADGRGGIVLIVARGNASALYSAPALLTATSVEADLGSLGQVSLGVAPAGRKKTLQSRCGEESESFSFVPQVYSGNFEFHGEEGYTDVGTASVREYSRFFVDLFCSDAGSGETGGPGLPGARLRLHSHVGSTHLNLQANKNRPGARTRFEVGVHEKRRGISISRARTLWLGAAGFDYNPHLRTARLEPPEPFAGQGTFRRGAAVVNRWSGNLTVDLPGRSDVPLTGPTVSATLVPGCWHEGGRRFRC